MKTNIQIKEKDLASDLKTIKDIVFWMEMNTNVISKEEYRKKLGQIRGAIEQIENNLDSVKVFKGK
jgi:hypothetical protein